MRGYGVPHAAVIHRGICSVTLRAQPAPRVVDVAITAGLSCVEWGADGHVPPGDLHAARHLRDAGAGAGLRVASYGSYHRPGADPRSAFVPVLDTAVALGAPRIRVWAGVQGSADATPADRRLVVADTRAAADRAADAGVRLAFEYHPGTLTDSARSTLDLLADVDRPNVLTYWQPPPGMPDGAAVDDLRRVLEWVTAVHVFSWWPGHERHPLARRGGLWRAVFTALRRCGRDVDALLEFVVDDDVSAVPAEARSLAALVEGRSDD